MMKKSKVTRIIHERVADVKDTQVEHMILRTCLFACKVMHLLRVHGDDLSQAPDVLSEMDDVQRGSLNRLFPRMSEASYTQAGLSVAAGGLGL